MVLDSNLVRRLAETYHTPLYVFVEETIRRQCRLLKSVISYPKTRIRYACKALTIGAILEIIREEGLSIDASSLNEVKRAGFAGFLPDQIIYTGESASRPVFEALLETKVPINCSSLDQMVLLGQISPGGSVSFRLNPGEGHGANDKVNTGGPASKHGIYFDQLDEVRRVAEEFNLQITGVHTHVGSGADLEHWLRINTLTLDVARSFKGLKFINLGGGLPIVYNPESDAPMPLEAWGRELSETFQTFAQQYDLNLELQIEPGRFIVAECGYLLGEVQNIKTTPDYTFVLVNTGFTHNPRPAMYGSYHPISFVPLSGHVSQRKQKYVIAGNLCESGDVFTRDEDGRLEPREFSEIALGEIMVMELVGAYSHAMKSEYNSMNLPASVLVRPDGSFRVIERRGTIDDILRREREIY